MSVLSDDSTISRANPAVNTDASRARLRRRSGSPVPSFVRPHLGWLCAHSELSFIR